MKLSYDKKPISFSEQVELLKSRGMSFDGIENPEEILQQYGYYRLSAYWYFFRQVAEGDRVDEFRPNTQFSEVIRLYEFDSRLRHHFLTAFEKIEIQLRTLITYHFSRYTKDAFGHYNSSHFHPNFEHTEWILQINAEVERSRDRFIQHFEKKYTGFPQIPIWMLTAVMSIGLLSRLFKGLPIEVRTQVSNEFSIHRKTLEGWSHTLSVLRNICAHHGRLWNRIMPIQKGYVNHPDWQAPVTPSHDRLFFQLLILLKLLPAGNTTKEWVAECFNILLPFLNEKRYRQAMGFPAEWQKHPLISPHYAGFETELEKEQK